MAETASSLYLYNYLLVSGAKKLLFSFSVCYLVMFLLSVCGIEVSFLYCCRGEGEGWRGQESGREKESRVEKRGTMKGEGREEND